MPQVGSFIACIGKVGGLDLATAVLPNDCLYSLTKLRFAEATLKVERGTVVLYINGKFQGSLEIKRESFREDLARFLKETANNIGERLR